MMCLALQVPVPEELLKENEVMQLMMECPCVLFRIQPGPFDDHAGTSRATTRVTSVSKEHESGCIGSVSPTFPDLAQ